jgi:hypothetical protein
MTGRVQTLRSNVAGNRPTGRQPGELYVNWADGQFGVISSAGAPQDLIAVTFYSTTASYAVGQFVIQAGQLYRCTVANGPGAFNPAQWSQIGGSVSVGDVAPANPQPGTLWWDSVGGQMYVWYVDPNTSQWVVANNGTSTDYLPLSGGTLTGPLTLAGDPVNPLDASTKQYIDARRTGVIDGSNAAAGQIGEVISTVNTTGASLATTVANNIASISLTPGDWDVHGEVWFSATGGAPSGIWAAITNVSNTFPSVVSLNQSRAQVIMPPGTPFSGGYMMLTPPTCRVNITSPAIYYVMAQCQFAAGTVQATAKIWARRMR